MNLRSVFKVATIMFGLATIHASIAEVTSGTSYDDINLQSYTNEVRLRILVSGTRNGYPLDYISIWVDRNSDAYIGGGRDVGESDGDLYYALSCTLQRDITYYSHGVAEYHEGGRVALVSDGIRCPSPPVITSSWGTSGYKGDPMQYQITATNSPATYSVLGTLPSGMSTNRYTGLISGTPGQSGTFPITVRAENAGGIGTKSVELRVYPKCPQITSPSEARTREGMPFSHQVVATFSPTSYGADGLPLGLSIAAATGLVSGTPLVDGIFDVTLQATNSDGTGTQHFYLTIDPGRRIIRMINGPNTTWDISPAANIVLNGEAETEFTGLNEAIDHTITPSAAGSG